MGIHSVECGGEGGRGKGERWETAQRGGYFRLLIHSRHCKASVNCVLTAVFDIDTDSCSGTFNAHTADRTALRCAVWVRRGDLSTTQRRCCTQPMDPVSATRQDKSIAATG